MGVGSSIEENERGREAGGRESACGTRNEEKNKSNGIMCSTKLKTERRDSARQHHRRGLQCFRAALQLSAGMSGMLTRRRARRMFRANEAIFVCLKEKEEEEEEEKREKG